MILYEYIKCNKENVSIYDFYHAKKTLIIRVQNTLAASQRIKWV